MSGGAFDYAYWKVGQFSEELKFMVESPEQPLDPKTEDTLREIVIKSNKFAEVMRAVEWFYSGDISEEEMMKRIKENE